MPHITVTHQSEARHLRPKPPAFHKIIHAHLYKTISKKQANFFIQMSYFMQLLI